MEPNSRFGMLTTTGNERRSEKFRMVEYECRCDCGTVKWVVKNSLVKGLTKSCGCLRRKATGDRFRSPDGVPGAASQVRMKTPLGKTYAVWGAIIQRCTNPNHPAWKHYGGRGITVCNEWRNFDNFLRDMGEQPPGLTLDRTNNNGNYEPANCRWATWHEQAANRRKRAHKK